MCTSPGSFSHRVSYFSMKLLLQNWLLKFDAVVLSPTLHCRAEGALGDQGDLSQVSHIAHMAIPPTGPFKGGEGECRIWPGLPAGRMEWGMRSPWATAMQWMSFSFGLSTSFYFFSLSLSCRVWIYAKCGLEAAKHPQGMPCELSSEISKKTYRAWVTWVKCIEMWRMHLECLNL